MSTIENHNLGEQSKISTEFLLGSLVTLTSKMVLSPLDKVKIMLQTQDPHFRSRQVLAVNGLSNGFNKAF
jgi:hypothetical protein